MGLLKNVARMFGRAEDGVPAGANAGGGGDIKLLAFDRPARNGNHNQEEGVMADDAGAQDGSKTGRFLGSLKDALAAAGRDETGAPVVVPAGGAAGQPASAGDAAVIAPPPLKDASAADGGASASAGGDDKAAGGTKSAADAAREARASAGGSDGSAKSPDSSAPPTTRVVKPDKVPYADADQPERTQLVRGKKPVERGSFNSDPVVGWLVIVGGPGIGQYRPIFEGNNAIGRSSAQRIALDFGDDAISSEEQAYIRYDSSDRSFLFVPNLAKTNVVSVNNKRPTGAVELAQMDVITMGRTQLVFVPFCGTEFDWAELIDAKN